MGRKKSYRAFSLIEAAIVLGIIGLVIGAIWLGAEQVMMRNKVNSLVQGTLYYFDAVRKSAKGMPGDITTIGSIVYPDVAAIKHQVPADWVAQTTPYTILRAPGGLMTYLGYGTDASGGTQTVYLMFDFTGKRNMCKNFLVSLTNMAWRDITLLSVNSVYYGGGSDPSAALLPGPLSVGAPILANCAAAANPLYVAVGVQLYTY